MISRLTSSRRSLIHVQCRHGLLELHTVFDLFFISLHTNALGFILSTPSFFVMHSPNVRTAARRVMTGTKLEECTNVGNSLSSEGTREKTNIKCHVHHPGAFVQPDDYSIYDAGFPHTWRLVSTSSPLHWTSHALIFSQHFHSTGVRRKS